METHAIQIKGGFTTFLIKYIYQGYLFGFQASFAGDFFDA